MDKRVIRKWRKMLVRGLITPSEHMLFRKIMELELENSQLKEIISNLKASSKGVSKISNKVNEISTRNVGNQNPVTINLKTRPRDLPNNHEPTLEELCRPLSAKAAPRSFRL